MKMALTNNRKADHHQFIIMEEILDLYFFWMEHKIAFRNDREVWEILLSVSEHDTVKVCNDFQSFMDFWFQIFVFCSFFMDSLGCDVASLPSLIRHCLKTKSRTVWLSSRQNNWICLDLIKFCRGVWRSEQDYV